MSGPLQNFSIRIGKPIPATGGDFDEAPAYFGDPSEANFLTAQTNVPESFLNIAEDTSRPPVNTTNTIVNSQPNILGDNNEVVGNEAPLLCLDPSTGLHVLVHSLCQTSGITQPLVSQPSSQDTDSNNEKFVVVWALQPEDENNGTGKATGSQNKTQVLDGSSCVDSILGSPVMALESNDRDDSGVEHILASSIGPSLDLGLEIPTSQTYDKSSNINEGSNSSLIDIEGSSDGSPAGVCQPNINFIDCHGAPMLRLQQESEDNIVSDERLQQNILMNNVPHINLTDVTKKLTAENSQSLIGKIACSSNATPSSSNITRLTGHKTHSANGIDSEYNITNPENRITHSKNGISYLTSNFSPSTSSNIFHSSDKDDTVESPSSLMEDSATTKSSILPKCNVSLKLKTCTSSSSCSSFTSNIADESLDEESFYDILMTYKCKLCSEVFFDKARLLNHYGQVHKSKKNLKIYVSADANKQASRPSDSCSYDKETNVYPEENGQKSREMNLITCHYCSRTFLGAQKLQQHVEREHPVQSRKKVKKKNKITHIPNEPGLLLGHRESRLPRKIKSVGEKEINESSMANDDSSEMSDIENQRLVRQPKHLNDNEWAHMAKQKQRPVLVNNEKRVYKCTFPECRFRFTSPNFANMHLECHGPLNSKEKKKFSCNKCPEKFTKWIFCSLHMWKSHEIDIDLFACGICKTYKTSEEQRLLVHQKIHSDTLDYKCQVCGKKFRQLSQLLNHESIHKETDSIVFCDQCQTWFADSHSLRRHRKRIHLKMKLHKCLHCDYKSDSKYSLDSHLRTHSGVKPLECELCHRCFRHKSALQKHKVVHFLKKLIHCPIKSCDYEASRSTQLKNHMAKKHPDEKDLIYSCRTCSFKTSNAQEYARHVNVHFNQFFSESLEKRKRSLDMDVDTFIRVEALEEVKEPSKTISVECNEALRPEMKIEKDYFFFEVEPDGSGSVVQRSTPHPINEHQDHQNIDIKLPMNIPSDSLGIGVKFPSQFVTSMSDEDKSYDVLDSNVNDVEMKTVEQSDNSFQINPESFVFKTIVGDKNINVHNSQVCTISVDNFESLNTFLKSTENCCELPKEEDSQQDGFDEILKANLLGPNSHVSSTVNFAQKHDSEFDMNVDNEPVSSVLESKSHSNAILAQDNQNNNTSQIISRTQVRDLGQDMLRSGSQTNAVLDIVEPNCTASHINPEENQALMTLSQVISSEDGQQYIIGIAPEQI